MSETLQSLVSAASKYFDAAAVVIRESEAKIVKETGVYVPNRGIEQDSYWKDIPDPLKQQAKQLVAELLAFANSLSAIVRSSPLNSDTDQQEVMVSVKSMRSALILRKFEYWTDEVVQNDGVVIGIQRATQSDEYPMSPSRSKQTFVERAEKLTEILQLAEAGGKMSSISDFSMENISKPNASRYSPNTAFIMMSMDNTKPELDDIRDAVKEVFKSFSIEALRADDIEHDGIITEQVRNKIATSEFLFADLTGERPNVYYEVGYAHGIGKRVILYCKMDTKLHFDLAGYNCPTYKNISDLKTQLTKRLIALTNRNPK